MNSNSNPFGIRRTMSSSSVETVYFDALEDAPFLNTEIVTPTPTTNTLNRIKEKFKLTRFIPNQRESIEAAINGDNILLILPSGPLRNTCYIAPASESQKTTIVIVPSLLYLTQQDDYYLSTYNIPYIFTSKTTSYKSHWMSCDQLESYCLNCIRQKKTLASLIYMTCHEFTRLKTTLTTLDKHSQIDRFIVDEAHCISQWGTDFQFAYLRFAETLKRQFPYIPVTAITAIPNERIHIDIMHTLCMMTCQVFKKSILL